MLDASEDKIKTVNELLSFLKKYPDWKDKKPLTTEPYLNKLKGDEEVFIKELKKKHKIKKGEKWNDTDLISRTRTCDKKYPTKNRKGIWEYNYQILYRYFSPYAHLNSMGIDSFVKNGANGFKYLITAESPESINRIAITLYSHYLFYLEYLLKRKILSQTVSLKKFGKVMQTLNTRNQKLM